MRKIVAQLIATLFVVGAAAGQTRVGSSPESAPGAAYFAQAQQALAENPRANVLPQIQQGWSAVQAAGPADANFATGVNSAADLFRALGRDRDAESLYTQAILSCSTPESADQRKVLRHRLAHYLILDRQFVRAEASLKEAVADEESSPRRSPLYVAFLQGLSFVREQEGELDDAERILLNTMGYRAPYFNDPTTRNSRVFSLPALPMTGDPNQVLAAFYERHFRLAEAERLLRDQLARTVGNPNLHLAATRRLVSFLSMQGSNAEAVELQKQVVAHVKADHSSFYVVKSEENNLARYEVAAGQAEQAKQLLENNLAQAENNNGRGSPEYGMALYALLENRRSAQDYETAEKLAQQQLDDVQQSDHPNPNLLAMALSQLAQVKQIQGRTEEADKLQKLVAEKMSQAYSGRGWDFQQRFNAVMEMIQQDKPAGPALAEIQSIASSFYPLNASELYQFQNLAQSFLVHAHQPEGMQVVEIISSLQQREGLDSDPRFALHLVDWATLLASLGDRTRAGATLQNARSLLLDCCGENSPKLEYLLREDAMINDNPTAVIAGLERLRDFEILVFGANNETVENSTAQLAHFYSEAGDWEQAKELFRTVLRINVRRTGARGPEYVARLDHFAMVFLNHHEYGTALELNQRALEACTGFVWADQTRSSLEQRHQQIAAAMAAEKRNAATSNAP